MINTIIIEDEKSALENLMQQIRETTNEIEVIATLKSVHESIEFLNRPPQVDLILCDVQLEDGLSFDIFNHTCQHAPVIFITGFDQFTLNAFECNGIEYLLKPINKSDLTKALAKYKMLENHFAHRKSMNQLLETVSPNRKRRLLVKRGTENISLPIKDVVMFSTEHKLVYAFDPTGKKYLVDKNLSELELCLEGETFFRANRQCIININFIKGFRSFEKVKLQVSLNVSEIESPIIVSQETAPHFKEWMHNA